MRNSRTCAMSLLTASLFAAMPTSVLGQRSHHMVAVKSRQADPARTAPLPKQRSVCQPPPDLPAYQPHDYTQRPFAEYEVYQPRFLSIFSEIDALPPDADVLEIGSGSGRALLDLKAAYPNMGAFGTNYKGYGLSQTDGTRTSLWSVAKHFNISVGCFDDGKPALPTIFETWGIQSPEYSSVLEGRKFDLIISRHALNNGKLRPSESAFIIPRILPLLKVGRLAMVHMLYDPALNNFTTGNDFTILSINTIGPPQAAVSIILYQNRCDRATCFSLVIKRCSPNGPWNPFHGDCILPRLAKVLLPSPDWMPSQMASALQQASSDAVRHRLQYAQSYLTRLTQAMRTWEDAGNVFVLNEVP